MLFVTKTSEDDRSGQHNEMFTVWMRLKLDRISEAKLGCNADSYPLSSDHTSSIHPCTTASQRLVWGTYMSVRHGPIIIRFGHDCFPQAASDRTESFGVEDLGPSREQTKATCTAIAVWMTLCIRAASVSTRQGPRTAERDCSDGSNTSDQLRPSCWQSASRCFLNPRSGLQIR